MKSVGNVMLLLIFNEINYLFSETELMISLVHSVDRPNSDQTRIRLTLILLSTQ